MDGWLTLIEAGEKHALTRALMEQHYDLCYAKSSRSRGSEVIATVNLPALDAVGLSDAAAQVEQILSQL